MPMRDPVRRLLKTVPAFDYAAIGLLVVSAVLYTLFVFRLHQPDGFVFSDMKHYATHGQRILDGNANEGDLIKPMGYPLLVAASLSLNGAYTLVKGLHVIAAVASLFLLWRSAAALFGSTIGLLSLAAGVVHYPFLSQTGFLMPDAIYTLLNAVLFYLLIRFPLPWSFPLAAAIGAVFQIGMWFKGNNGFFFGFLLVWASLKLREVSAESRPAALKAYAVSAAGFLASMAVILALHWVVTDRIYHTASFVSRNAGLSLIEGKCPAKRNQDKRNTVWQSSLFGQIGENLRKKWDQPFTNDSFFVKEGLKCIAADPLVLLTSVRYVYFLFLGNDIWPSNADAYKTFNRGYGMLFGAIYLPGILIALLLLLRHPLSAQSMPILLMVLSLFFNSWLFKSEIRYRVPFDVVFLPMAVYGWHWLLTQLFPKTKGRVAQAFWGLFGALGLATLYVLY